MKQCGDKCHTVVVIWGVLTHPPQIIQKITQKIQKIFQNRREELRGCGESKIN
eukprot:SAG11_NODE_2701_length_3076_cov_5.049043_1_plen_52_part_10